MKIGILTLQYGFNYGGVLQCYALQSFLESLGHEVQVINYVPTMTASLGKRILTKFKTITSLSDFIHNLKDFTRVRSNVNKQSAQVNENIKKIFDNFRENRLKLSARVDEWSIGTIQNQYDVVIVGSDQVWTSLYGKRHIYFLDWLSNEYTGKRIAYAACSAHKAVNGGTRNVLSDLLVKMDAIGVRDTTTYSLVKSINPSLDATIVADPTLLYDFEEFQDVSIPQTPYILTYILGTEIEGGHLNAIKKIKDKVGDLPVISIILPNMSSGIEKFSDKVLMEVTPEQWVALIRGAEAVYTDSFHGIIFSLKYKKSFMGYYSNAIRSSRLIDLKLCFPSLPIYNSVPSELDISYKWEGNDYINLSRDFIRSHL